MYSMRMSKKQIPDNRMALVLSRNLRNDKLKLGRLNIFLGDENVTVKLQNQQKTT